MIAALWLMLGAFPCASETFAFTNMGDVRAFGDSKDPAAVVLWVHDDNAHDVADALASRNMLVVSIQTSALVAGVQEAKSPCCYPAGDLEAVSHYVQMKRGFPQYQRPVLLGSGRGGGMVYATLGQTPPNTFAGVITRGACADLPLKRGVCRGRGLKSERDNKDSLHLLPVKNLDEPVLGISGALPGNCKHPIDAAFLSATAHGENIGVADPNAPWTELEAAVLRLAGVNHDTRPRVADDLNDLPLIEVPATEAMTGNTLAVIVSGDGGWASIDREVASSLVKAGIPVVGLSSLQYFWHKRNPDGASDDLARIVRRYAALWGKERAIVVGFSLGADVLPFMVNRLPADVQDRIDLVTLLAPSPRVSFEFHLTDWIGGAASSDAMAVQPEADKIKRHVLCIQNARDDESPCAGLEHAEVVKLPGGHHFDGDYAGLAQRIIEARQSEPQH